MTHRRRYAVSTNRDTVLDLLALDALNPRSVLYSANALQEHVSFLPGSDVFSQKSPLARAVLRMQTDPRVLTPETLDKAALLPIQQQAYALSDIIAATYFK